MSRSATGPRPDDVPARDPGGGAGRVAGPLAVLVGSLALVALVALVALAGAGVAPARAQGTGAGEVISVRVGDVILEAPRRHRSTRDDLAARAEVFVPRIQEDLGVELAGPVRLVLLPGGGELPNSEYRSLDGSAPPWAAGFAIPERRVGAIRLDQASRYPFGDPGGVLAHEIVHFLLHDAAGGRLPRWFDEGVATREGREWGIRDAFVYSSAVLTGSLPSLDRLDRAFRSSEAEARLAYAASFDFVRWASRRYPEEAGDGAGAGQDTLVRGILAEARRGASFPRAFETAAGVPLAEAERAWRSQSLALWRWIPAATSAGTLWILVTGLFLLAAWRRRQRTKEKLERMEEELGG